MVMKLLHDSSNNRIDVIAAVIVLKFALLFLEFGHGPYLEVSRLQRFFIIFFCLFVAIKFILNILF